MHPHVPSFRATCANTHRDDASRPLLQRLASWGYVCMLYDKRETVNDVINDDTSVKLVRELIDWASVDPVLVQLCDSNSVYLVGHSRGGKISALTAARDVRVKAVLLIDPVDNTQYAPLGPGERGVGLTVGLTTCVSQPG